MKVGLVTIFQVPNYGSILQTYATQYLLTRLGVQCEVINYNYPNDWHYKHGSSRPNCIKSLIRSFFPTEKSKKLKNFREKFLRLSPLYRNFEELKNNDWTNYGGFIVGSDQVWNVRFMLGDPTFLLSFVPSEKKRFSLASSIALNSLPIEYQEVYRKELSNFTSISVRETNAINIINEELNIKKDIKVLLDPTLLLCKDDWGKLFSKIEFHKSRPYILLYMWAYAYDPRPYIYEVLKYFRNKLSCEIVILEGNFKELNKYGINAIDKTNSSIPEFLSLFENAELVITSSFHGTAFALNYGVPLVSIVPNSECDDRQTSLLRRVGAENCVVQINSHIEYINPYYNKDRVNDSLMSIREDNLYWIKKNIIDCLT